MGQDLVHGYRPTTMQNLVADFSPFQELGMYGTAQRAMQGSPLEGMAQGAAWHQMNNSTSPMLGQMYSQSQDPSYGAALGMPWMNTAMNNLYNVPSTELLEQTARGDFLDGNPYLDNAFGAQTDAMTRAYREGTAPSTMAQFAGAGRLRGSGSAYHDATARNEAELMRGLENAGANIYERNYTRERGLQEQAKQTLADSWLRYQQQQLQGAQAMGQMGSQAASDMRNLQNSFANQYYTGLQNQMSAADRGMEYAMRDYQNLAALNAVGDQYQNMNQRKLDDAARVHEYYQTGDGSPIAALARYWNPAFQAGAAFPQTKSEGQTVQQTNPGAMGIAGGLTSMLGGLFG